MLQLGLFVKHLHSGVVATSANAIILLQPFDLKELLYFDYKHLDEKKEKELGAQFAEFDELIEKCDVITVNLPLTDKTKWVAALLLLCHVSAAP